MSILKLFEKKKAKDLKENSKSYRLLKLITLPKYMLPIGSCVDIVLGISVYEWGKVHWPPSLGVAPM